MRSGETVYFPAHGIAKVERTETAAVDEKRKEVLVLRITSSNMSVMVPRDNMAVLGIRPLISKTTTRTLYDVIGKPNGPLKSQSWKDRNKEFLQKIRSGSPFELAKIIRDLNQLKESKPLSFCEKRMFETAKRLLGEEIAYVRREKPTKVLGEIEARCNWTGRRAQA